MGRPLQVPKLDFIGSICATDLHGELHLQELVRFLPVNLNAIAERHCHGLTGRNCTHPSLTRLDQVQYNSH